MTTNPIDQALATMRTRREADLWVAAWRRRKKRHQPRMRVYECPHCHAWHFTHRAKPLPLHKRTKGASW